MKKTFILLLFSLSLQAEGVIWLSMDKAYSLAKKHKKAIMVFVYKEGCSACADIESRIDKNLLMQSSIKQVLPVKISYSNSKNIFPSTMVTPTFYFIDANGRELLPAVKGSPSSDYEFMDYITSAAAVAEILDTQAKK